MLAIIGFLVFMHLYAQRIGMSVAVVCMLNQTALEELESMETMNSTVLSWHNPNETDWSVNATIDLSAESKCSRWMAHQTAVSKVNNGTCLLL